MLRTTTDSLTLKEDEVRKAIQEWITNKYSIDVGTENITILEDRIHVKLRTKIEEVR